MKTKLLQIVTLCGVAALVGCRTVSVENNGEGKGWKVSVMSNMMKSELDNMKATINPDGSITYEMGGLQSSPSEEFAKSLMTMVYLGRIAASMYSPAAATVPLSEEAADPEAVSAAVKAQADAKVALANAKADAAVKKIEAKSKAEAAAKSADCACTDCKCPNGTCPDCSPTESK